MLIGDVFVFSIGEASCRNKSLLANHLSSSLVMELTDELALGCYVPANHQHQVLMSTVTEVLVRRCTSLHSLGINPSPSVFQPVLAPISLRGGSGNTELG